MLIYCTQRRNVSLAQTRTVDGGNYDIAYFWNLRFVSLSQGSVLVSAGVDIVGQQMCLKDGSRSKAKEQRLRWSSLRRRVDLSLAEDPDGIVQAKVAFAD
jgi:hypothetical protein